MGISLVLSNCFWCGIAALFLLPLLRSPYILTYHKGIPVFLVMMAIAVKLLIPFEFPFTTTLVSKNILPFVREVWYFSIFKKVTMGQLLVCLWLLIAVLLNGIYFYRYRRLVSRLSRIPETESKEIHSILSSICDEEFVVREPKIIQANIHISPFTTGLRRPIIVLPGFQISALEMRHILRHELEHISNHHIWFRALIEVLTAVFWWNPLIWLFRRAIIRSLELQADIRAVQGLNEGETSSYFHSLISVAKKVQKGKNRSFALAFVIGNDMLAYRVKVASRSNCCKRSKRIQICSLMLPLLFIFSSFAFTFAACSIDPDAEAHTFAVTPQNAYFVRDNGRYDLYVDRKFVGTLDHKPDEFSDLSIYD